MTLLRMLAFKPAGQAETTSGGTGRSSGSRDEIAAPAARPGTDAKVAAAGSPATLREADWGQLVGQLDLKGSVRMLAGNCALEDRRGNTVHFSLDSRSESLLTRQRKDAIADALSRHFDENLNVEISVSDVVSETPHQKAERISDEKIDAARKSLESDPNVQTLKNMFGAELRPDSIELINPPRSD